jgi:aspartate aminotransferase
MSFFEAIETLPPDPIFSLPLLFKEDNHPHKVNLSIGAYQDEKGQPHVLEAVNKAEQILLKQNLTKNYLPIAGNTEFIDETLKLIFDSSWLLQAHSRLVAAQSLGGAGALRLGGELLFKQVSTHISLSTPTWPNHQGIFGEIGFKIENYAYYDENKKKIALDKFCESLKKLPPSTIVLLQACCHNPTGLSPNIEQWKELSHLIQEYRLFPFFDLAYQGFDKSLEEDVAAIRLFANQGHEMMVAYSFSKNMGLYGERVGIICAVTANADSAKKVRSQLLPIIRHNYSNPPIHGARLAAHVLKTPELFKLWINDLQKMRGRVDEMRNLFVQGLISNSAKMDFSFLDKQRGLFAYSGLSLKQVNQLREEFGIYLLYDGRLNLAGLNHSNLNYVVESILKVIS